MVEQSLIEKDKTCRHGNNRSASLSFSPNENTTIGGRHLTKSGLDKKSPSRFSGCGMKRPLHVTFPMPGRSNIMPRRSFVDESLIAPLTRASDPMQ